MGGPACFGWVEGERGVSRLKRREWKNFLCNGSRIDGMLRDGKFRCCRGNGDGRDEAIATTGEGFDEAWVIGGVPEGLADFIDSSAEGLVEVSRGLLAPDSCVELFTGEDFARALEKSGEDTKGLTLELDAVA